MSNTLGEYPVYAHGNAVGRVRVSQDGLMIVFDCTCSYKSQEVLRLVAICLGKYVPLGVTMPCDDKPCDGRPNDGLLCLNRRFSKNALASLGYTNAESFHLIGPGEVLSAYDLPAASESIFEEYYRPAQAPELSAPSEPQELYEPEKAPELSAPSSPEEPPVASCWKHIDKPGVLFSDTGVAAACEDVEGALLASRNGYDLLAVPVSPGEPFPMMSVFCFGSPGEVGGHDYIIFKIRDGNLIL